MSHSIDTPVNHNQMARSGKLSLKMAIKTLATALVYKFSAIHSLPFSHVEYGALPLRLTLCRGV